MSDHHTHKANEAEQALERMFGASQAALPGNGNVPSLRDRSFKRFASQGFPTRRLESWHYSDLRSVMREALPLAQAPGQAEFAIAADALAKLQPSGNRLVLVDGVYQSTLANADARLAVNSLEDALANGDITFPNQIAPVITGGEDGALALNAAMMSGGVVVSIPENTHLTAPLEIVFISTGGKDAALFLRSMVRALPGSSATIVERHINCGASRLQKNDVLVCRADDGAQLSHVFIADGAGSGLTHVNSLIAGIGEKARFSSFALLDTGAFVRRQLFVRFYKSHSELDLGGLALIRNKDHVDTTLVVDHVHPDCSSKEYFKQIVDGSGTGVFQGKVSVAPEAQKTDGAMKSQTILLSDDAAMYNKPELEIFADDVACGHGATVGALDPNQLFYAMARGLPRNDAESLLLEAFGADAIERVGNEALKEELRSRLRHWLDTRIA